MVPTFINSGVHFPTYPDWAVSKTGGASPKAALKPRLTNRSPRRATTSFALLVTLGSCESLRTKGMNLLIVLTAALLFFVEAVNEDAPCVPKRRPIFHVRCMTGVGSGSVSVILSRSLAIPVVTGDGESCPAPCSSLCSSTLFCNSSTNERKAFAAPRSSWIAKALAALVMYINVSWPKLSASTTIWSAISFRKSSPSLDIT
mmetsp:Transcript_44851/g.95469  ORF Transcript_44851/g.95469 Transcript_44851/m.95469 type:complete len:202 (+) Transcript_44851:73-678(+)